MKKYLIGTLCLALLSGMYACDSGSKEETTETAETADVIAQDSALTEDRQELLAYTVRHIMLQKEFATTALQKAQTQNLKAYAQDLNNWATTKQTELQELAQQYNLTLPQQLSEEEQEYLKKASEADKEKYDEEVWESMIKAQKDAISHIDGKLKDVESTDATAFVLWERNTLQELRAHMEQAAAYELELENREGGISKPIVEDINN